MTKINKTIEVARSSVASLSSMNLQSATDAVAVLSNYYTHVRLTTLNTVQDLEAMVLRSPDLVFVGLKFVPKNPELGFNDPDKIWLADYLDACGIAYTGSGRRAHELELDKSLAKLRMERHGIATAGFYVALQNMPTANHSLQFPLFVKPTNKGGGLGIDAQSVVHTSSQLAAKVASIASKYAADALVEEYLTGREFSVAVLQKPGASDYYAMPLELIAPMNENGDRLLSDRVKSADSETFVAVTNLTLRKKVSALALKAFAALGAEGYGRIDIRLNALGVPQFLEANLVPSLLKDYGNFPKACALNMGIDYETVLERIAALGFAKRSARLAPLHAVEAASAVVVV